MNEERVEEILTDAVDFDSGKTEEEINFTDNNTIANDKAEEISKWNLRDRLRSKVLWASILGCIITIFSVLGVWEKIGVTSEQFSDIAGAIGSLLAMFGVFNDPTSADRF